MCEGYEPAEDDGIGALDDELLCEYVDGVMDPSVRRAFEDYLRANPRLAERADDLRHIRLLLSQYGCRCQAPVGLQRRLHRQVTCEMMRSQRPLFPTVTSRLSSVAAFTSAMGVMLVIGMVVGAMIFSEPPAPTDYSAFAAPADVPALFTESHRGAIVLPHAVSTQYYGRYSSFGSVPAIRSLWQPERPPLTGTSGARTVPVVR